MDISAQPSGSNPQGLVNIVGQTLSIMGRHLAEQEATRADVVIRPRVVGIGPTDFAQKNQAILEGEKAALAAMPQIRQRLAALQAARTTATPAH